MGELFPERLNVPPEICTFCHPGDNWKYSPERTEPINVPPVIVIVACVLLNHTPS